MGETTIEWTEKSWNPIAAYYEGKRGWMCSKPSAGCKNCYSERMNVRLGNGLRYTPENVAKVDWQLVNLDEPGRWRKPALCFVESMGDLFHEGLPDELIERVWLQMLEYPQHTFQVLTKRAARMRELVARFTKNATRSADHVWLGVSVENQEQADKRIPELLKVPARVCFLSCEPLLGPVNLGFSLARIDWVIAGGESGPGARPMHPDWARSLRDQCQAAGVPFFFKQWGEWANWEIAGLPKSNLGKFESSLFSERPYKDEDAVVLHRVGKKNAGRLLDGREWNEMPGV